MNVSAQFFLHFAFAQMLITALLLIPSWQKSESVKLFIALMLCGCGYLTGKLFGPINSMSILWWLVYFTSNTLAGVFGLVALSIFSEDENLEPWQYIIASMTLVIPTVSILVQVIFAFDLAIYPRLFSFVSFSAMLLELLLIGHAFVVAMKYWQADLVKERRYMRASVIALTATYLVLVIVVEQLFQLQWQELDTVKYALLTVLATSINLLLFSLKKDSLFKLAESKANLIKTVEQNIELSPELKKVLATMTDEKLYRQEGLTITLLSQHLSIQEYKLRQLINGELAYRNFNDFLNYYRIQEISEKLSRSENQQTPVLTLALESGFRSLSSFNKAFKNKHGVTPTEYRNQALLIENRT